MSASLKKQEKYISASEYFEIEAAAEYKSEYYNGEMFAMAGASINHNLIVSNIIIAMGNALQDSPCSVFPSDVKVQIEKAYHYVYPDVSIVCGDIEYAENRNDTITNPLVVFEVLSESSKDYDRGFKFSAYKNIASLKDYIIVEQNACHIQHFYKENNKWILKEFKKLSDSFEIKSVKAELFLKMIYRRVKL